MTGDALFIHPPIHPLLSPVSTSFHPASLIARLFRFVWSRRGGGREERRRRDVTLHSSSSFTTFHHIPFSTFSHSQNSPLEHECNWWMSTITNNYHHHNNNDNNADINNKENGNKWKYIRRKFPLGWKYEIKFTNKSWEKATMIIETRIKRGRTRERESQMKDVLIISRHFRTIRKRNLRRKWSYHPILGVLRPVVIHCWCKFVRWKRKQINGYNNCHRIRTG